jgi:uncharacterized protein (DUF1800 family)
MTRPHASLLLGAALASVATIRIAAVRPPVDDRAIAHVLNRIGYGPRPGDVESVRRLGIAVYTDQQLHPERVSDAAMTSRLAGLTTLDLSSREIALRFERPALQARRGRKQEAANRLNPDTGPILKGLEPADPDRRQANVPLMDLAQQKILRAVYSERQLEEVLTDFWFNHFNVDARKGPARYMLTAYERDDIRPHVLGHFRDLLEATAKSPAMLFYLDNWQSADPNGNRVDTARRSSPGDGAPARRPLRSARRDQMLERRPDRPRGLNENYGRELLELHTLGVDGGYTQNDVTEVARAFTGWSIDNPREGGGFRFVARLHDPGEKVVLGHRIQAGGQQDGELVLDILASHPSTARFIAAKLVRRFVSDAPPQALVDRAASKFRETKGDLRAVMTVLLTSPQFLSPEVYRAKVKTPFEFVVSALRATGAAVDDARPLVRSIQQLGMPLYQCQPPTGYKDTADAWVNTGALVNRMNEALALAEGSVRGVRIVSAPPPEALLSGDLSEATRGTVAKASTATQAIALALGSPEFQRR